jgi:hypothetical protein
LREAAVPANGDDRTARLSPVIVLAYSFSGSQRIWRLLSQSGVLACTSGTGLLPLCENAAETWRLVDDRDGPLSALAISSIRALAGSMITVMLASTGKSRWCEISFSLPTAAETFLRLYPGTKFICLHRSCPDVIRAGIEANPWGLGDTSIGRFAAAYPGSNAAAIAAYWAERTESLLLFEAAHPAACLRVNYQALASQPDRVAEAIFAFLDLAPGGPDMPFPETEAAAVPAEHADRLVTDTPALASYIPPPLKQAVNRFQARLDYPPIA